MLTVGRDEDGKREEERNMLFVKSSSLLPDPTNSQAFVRVSVKAD
jgi:hypothetical protein